ncbi:MAG: glutamine synthetase III, partial [Clostridia bacterium]|nr:glutamine synthetase III [Clostridia bacterium]
GKTAEKQVSFVERAKNGKVIEEFTEKSLIKSEADASSFPSGGERATFEARGYIVWDYTSPAFIKEDSMGNRNLCIPTAFCSYSGIALDEKTPLLRALESVNKEALRVLHMIGIEDVKKVVCNIGVEQEYFLIKKEFASKRKDISLIGRTLLGEKPIKTQEANSHYFGMIDDEVSVVMNEIDRELWKLGVLAKLQHNEVAPCQFELVPIFAEANISCDQNQLVMETIKRVAEKHGFVALLEEKPFAGVNGSGKHMNWSLSTDTGMNVFDSKNPNKDVFLLFFVAMISAVSKHHKLLRASASSRGNDLRLGGDEAPPKVISMFVGDEIEAMFEEKFEKPKKKILDVGVSTLPKPKKDFSDRNRTTPFSYNGNKFEFRMVGSLQSVSWPCTCLTTMFAAELESISNELEKAENIKEKIKEIVKKRYEKHKNIVFNGDGYSSWWKEESEKRGLSQIENSLDAFDVLSSLSVEELFEKMGVLSKQELSIRKNVFEKTYFETVLIEAKVMEKMVKEQILLALAEMINKYEKLDTAESLKIVKKLKTSFEELSKTTSKLKKVVSETEEKNTKENVEKVFENMRKIRNEYDSIEEYFSTDHKPFPTYDDILF